VTTTAVGLAPMILKAERLLSEKRRSLAEMHSLFNPLTSPWFGSAPAHEQVRPAVTPGARPVDPLLSEQRVMGEDEFSLVFPIPCDGAP